jgi:KaiC/GvpD/RAD55 family RecA-like ATPase
MPSAQDKLPLLDGLVPDGFQPGTILGVEFDPESHWFAVAVTIAAGYVKNGFQVGYDSQARPREAVIKDFENLGLNVSQYMTLGSLWIDDWYSATLSGGWIESSGGRTGPLFEAIEGGVRLRSLKVADLSVEWLKQTKGEIDYSDDERTPPGSLVVAESISPSLRFNDEKAYLEWVETRVAPTSRKSGWISLVGIVRGVHSDFFYKRLENALDGVIEVRVLERDDEAKNFLRIRGLKGKRYDAHWHEIQIKPNGEAILIG